jgi:hypothetical protein
VTLEKTVNLSRQRFRVQCAGVLRPAIYKSIRVGHGLMVLNIAVVQRTRLVREIGRCRLRPLWRSAPRASEVTPVITESLTA